MKKYENVTYIQKKMQSMEKYGDGPSNGYIERHKRKYIQNE